MKKRTTRKTREFVANSSTIYDGDNKLLSFLMKRRFPMLSKEFTSEFNKEMVEQKERALYNELSSRSIYFKRMKEYYEKNDMSVPNEHSMLLNYFRVRDTIDRMVNKKALA